MVLRLLFSLILLIPSISYASITVPWSSSMTGCPEWEWQSSADNDPGCDGLYRNLGQTTSTGKGNRITAPANNPDGPDGGSSMGLRHYVVSKTTVNEDDNAGGVKATLNNPQSHLWVRYYQRWQSGNPGDWHSFKSVLVWESGSLIRFVTGYDSIDSLGMPPRGDNNKAQNVYWGVNVYPGGSSDGTWHAIEFEIDCSADDLRYWVEGSLVYEDLNAGLSCSSIDKIVFGDNIKYAYLPETEWYIDYDDMVITNSPGQTDASGNPYVGLISGSPATDTTDPVVSVTAPTDGTTVTGSVAVAASASDNVGVVGVQFKVDGVDEQVEDTTAPYGITLDTTALSDAIHSITAVARDAAGNTATSATVSVTVDNSVSQPPSPGELLLYEPCEDTNFLNRGWYDNTAGQVISATEYQTNEGSSTGSCEYHFTAGNTTPDSGTTIRHKFEATDEIYFEFWVKYSQGYIGSGNTNHPHEFGFLSTDDSDWSSPNYTYLQVKVESNELKPRFILRDDRRVNEANGTPPVDLTGVTENRASNGCNGELGTGGVYDCYTANGNWYNHKDFLYDQDAFVAGTWHKAVAYFKLNTVSGSTTNADGIIKYYINDRLIMDYEAVVFRTSQFPDIKFDQLFIAPWIGDGSPIDQTMWVDDIRVYSGYNFTQLLTTKLRAGTQALRAGTTPLITQ